MQSRRDGARPPAQAGVASSYPTRKRLADMTPEEVAVWAEARRDGLAAFVAEATQYRARRNWPGSENNPTN